MASISDIHVLVVDDNKHMRFLLRCLLRAGGLNDVAEAADVEDAFRQMRLRTPDLVIADWMMQPVDGIAFTRMVRWNVDSPNPYVPMLMLTAHTAASRVAEARDAGVNGFIKKPVSARVLFERVGNALTDTRMFIRAPGFIGPDRRHGAMKDYAGPYRRESDGALAPNPIETLDLDDLRWRA